MNEELIERIIKLTDDMVKEAGYSTSVGRDDTYNPFIGESYEEYSVFWYMGPNAVASLCVWPEEEDDDDEGSVYLSAHRRGNTEFTFSTDITEDSIPGIIEALKECLSLNLKTVT